MGKIEQRLFDLEEYLMRNDDRADSSAYLTIVGTANDASELETENVKLRELCADIYEMAYHEYPSAFEAAFADRMRGLRVEVDG